ncbi:hypothetical protein E3U55_14345 [Filobacillus milosensis]|uniref:Matrixin family metalloprotease n=1 Tax=Filobacillus milosensis TaxID=94137 RepID=A0A4Y8IG76_9BACI|nr:hypothetical protein [Filobacillus milosensis]TFB14094.1 hypothetical protein E3U55_14345 [Filobacillus milosensis]
MKTVMKYFVPFLLLVTMILFTFNISSFAHGSKYCNGGSETMGWKVYCSNYTDGHAGTSSITYKYSTDLEDKYKNYSQTAAGRWNMTGVVDISYSSSSPNIIKQYNDPNTSSVASVYTSSTNNNHKEVWTMYYNEYHMNNYEFTERNGIATHEMGHTIGLVDLENYMNIDKIMFGSDGVQVKYPQFEDIEGAKEAVK